MGHFFSPIIGPKNRRQAAVPAAVVHIHAVELSIPGHQRVLVALAGWLRQVLVGTYDDPHGPMMGTGHGPWSVDR